MKQDLLEVQNRIASILLTTPHDEMYGEVLDTVLDISESLDGVFAYIDENGAAVAPCITKSVRSKCRFWGGSMSIPRSEWKTCLCTRSITEKKSLILDRRRNVHRGCMQAERALAVPILYQDQAIGFIEVVDKKTPYTKKDVLALEKIVQFIAPALHARLQRQFEEKRRIRLEELFIKTFHSNPAASVISGLEDGKLLIVNSEFLKLTGFCREEVVGRTTRELAIYDNPADRSRMVRDLKKRGSLRNYALRLRTKSGELRETSWSFEMIRHEGQDLLLSIFLDVTDRKRIETALQNINESHMMAINAANEPIYDVDFMQSTIRWNETYSAMFGDPPRRGRKIFDWWMDKIHPDDRSKVLACISEARDSDLVRSINEYRFKRRDGSYAFIRDRFHICRDQEGKATRVVGTMLDITDQKRRESELELVNFELEKHAKVLDQILSAFPDYIFLFDVNGTYAYVNDKGAALLGKKKEDIMGCKWRDIGLNAEMTQELHPKIHQVIDENVIVKGEGKFTLNQSERHFEYTLIPVGNGCRPEGIMCAVRDITEHKQRDAELERKADELKATNRELESFSYSISHDLRAPLAAIKGISEMIIGEYRDKMDENGRSFLELIRSNVVMMDELINGVLMLSRVSRQELAKSRLEMNTIASDAYDRLKLASPGSRLDFKIGEMPESIGDPVLVKQVFSNLISNAIKFSGKRRRPKIEVGGYRKLDFCVYYVNDNGAGFKMKDYDKLFAIFQRLHNESEFEGTGVGLAIVQKIIQRHGGRIWAESRVNRGARFCFSLPAAEPEKSIVA